MWFVDPFTRSTAICTDSTRSHDHGLELAQCRPWQGCVSKSVGLIKVVLFMSEALVFLLCIAISAWTALWR